MTKKTRIAAALLVLALLLGGCGAAAPAKAAPSPTPGPTPTPTPRPDRNGFSPQKNQTVTLDGIEFSIPAYYTLTRNSTETTKNYYADGDSHAGLICCVWEGAFSDSDFQAKKNALANRLMKELNTTRIGDAEDFSVAGLTGFSAYGEAAEADVWLISVNDPGNKRCYGWILVESYDSPYDYTGDFEKILESVEILPAPTAEPKAQTSAGQVDPELKAMLDEYEEFIDEYVAFMKDFNSGKTVDLSRSVRLMTKYADLTAKIEAIDEKNLSDADYLYYSQVMLRVSQKLLEAAG